MKKEVLKAVRAYYGQAASAQDAVTFMFNRGIVNPKALRDWQIAVKFTKEKKLNAKRSNRDIISEISASDDFGRPSESTIKNAIKWAEDIGVK